VNADGGGLLDDITKTDGVSTHSALPPRTFFYFPCKSSTTETFGLVVRVCNYYPRALAHKLVFFFFRYSHMYLRNNLDHMKMAT
jgi:hypothetical protein